LMYQIVSWAHRKWYSPQLSATTLRCHISSGAELLPSLEERQAGAYSDLHFSEETKQYWHQVG